MKLIYTQQDETDAVPLTIIFVHSILNALMSLQTIQNFKSYNLYHTLYQFASLSVENRLYLLKHELVGWMFEQQNSVQ